MLNFISLLAQTAVQTMGQAVQQTEIATNHNLIHLILNADPMVWLSFVVLLIFSVVCWAIIIAKHLQIKRAETNSRSFYDLFWSSTKLADLGSKRGARKGPAYQIFYTAAQSLEANKNPHGKESLIRNVRRAYEEEVEQMEYGVPFLATTASTAPFIGLFGTVWGILNAFWKIGSQGSSSLAIVGPDIAQALIATAAGLAAAIPAVIFYNLFVNKIRRFSKELQDFTEDLGDRLLGEL